MTTWYASVGFGGNPAPRGPWRTAEQARDALNRWARRQGPGTTVLIAAHTLRVNCYETREAARSADISDTPGRGGCISIRGMSDFILGADDCDQATTLVIPGHPAIDVGPNMFDHCTNMTDLTAEYARVRRIVPQWHDDGRTRGAIARHWVARADELRGGPVAN